MLYISSASSKADLEEFLTESNKIEIIYLVPPINKDGLLILSVFLNTDELSIFSLLEAQYAIAPNAPLRDKIGMNVSVGGHIAPAGGLSIKREFITLLDSIQRHSLTPYLAHVEFEKLHPFMDGNGRTGRLLWLWQMLRLNWEFQRPFLHQFYYQTLQHFERIKKD